MIIVLNLRWAGGYTVFLYAYDEKYEAQLEQELPTPDQSAVKIHYGAGYLSLKTVKKIPILLDSDHFVSFKSAVPLNIFINEFNASSMATNKDYRILTRNCAHGADFALRLANILVSDSFSAYTPPTNFGVTSFITSRVVFTPEKFYSLAINHKIKEAESADYFSRVSFQYELASKAFSFWRKQQKPDNRYVGIDIIPSEMDKRQAARPHHSELHVKALLQLIDLLIKEQSDSDTENYQRLAYQFKERSRPDNRNRARQEALIMRFIVFELTTFIFCQNNNPSLMQRILMLCMLSIIFYFMIYKATSELQKQIQQDRSQHSDTKTTPLSTAMFRFSSFYSNRREDSSIGNAACDVDQGDEPSTPRPPK